MTHYLQMPEPLSISCKMIICPQQANNSFFPYIHVICPLYLENKGRSKTLLFPQVHRIINWRELWDI